LLGEDRHDRLELEHGRVRVVDVVEAGHGPILPEGPALVLNGIRTGGSRTIEPTIGRTTEDGMDLGLAGARALVGGASSGLGAAAADALVAEGARVALVARTADALRERVAVLGAGSVPVAADLSTPDGPASAVTAAIAALGGLDLVLVNSGGPPLGRFEDLDEATWERAIDGTLHSTLRLIRAALPHLRASDRPAIAIILSSSAREPIPGLTTSNVLRPGLAGLVKTLSAELAPIRINGIAPGRVATDRIAQLDAATAEREGLDLETIRRRMLDRIPLGRYGEPAEVGRVTAFLLSPAAAYVTGSILAVDGGMVRSLP
jgi:3-oxoacyl-[acyl-carrier protein] reductase